MTDQLKLIQTEPQLTDRQQATLDYIGQHDGVPADEVGANWHEIRKKHSAGDRCPWCRDEGMSVIRSKALRDLITFKRAAGGRLYILRGSQPASETARERPADYGDPDYDPATGTGIPF